MECSAAFASPLPIRAQTSQILGSRELGLKNATTTDTLDLTYRWHVEFPTLSGGFSIASPIFAGEVENKLRTEWQLKLYPDGMSEKTRGRVMLLLNLVNTNIAEIKVYYKLAIIDNSNEMCNVFQEEFFPGCTSQGTGLIERSKLVCPESLYLKNNKLEILCKIFSKAHKPESVIPETHSFRKFWKYVENRKYTDVTIKVDEKKFDVHKIVLVARSSVFAAMFDHDLKEANQNCVEISDFKHDTVEDFLKFIYNGEVNHEGNLLDLMACADKYNVEALKTKCEVALGGKLSVENAAEVLFRADLYGATSLKNKAIDFITYNIREIYMTDVWKSLSTELTSEVIFSMADTINATRASQNE